MTFNEKLNQSSNKISRIIITLALLSMLTISVFSTSSLNANAFDLSGIGSDNGLSGLDMGNICFASDCTNQNIKDNQNSPVVTKSDNTNIESGPGGINPSPDRDTSQESGSLMVSQILECLSASQLEDLCSIAQAKPQYPTIDEFKIVVTDSNNIQYSTTSPTIATGPYTITATLADTNPLFIAFGGGLSINYMISADGDCSQKSQSATEAIFTGTMTAGDLQTCNITYTLVLDTA